MDFYALDVETANEDYSSICQIGIAGFKNGEVRETYKTLVDPECEFRHINKQIHGIDELAVLEAPTFVDVYEDIFDKLDGKITVHHSPFDKVAMSQAADMHEFMPPDTQWLDSARIARRAWSQFAYSGYSLSNVTRELGISLKHHDALEDAIAAGKIAVKACEETGLSIDQWVYGVESKIKAQKAKKEKLTPNPEGILYGDTVVFTGSLISMGREEAKKVASEAGCVIKSNISKKVSLLVVGIQDFDKLNGYKKSSKHRKALKYIEKGHDINIITERDFIKMLETKG